MFTDTLTPFTQTGGVEDKACDLHIIRWPALHPKPQATTTNQSLAPNLDWLHRFITSELDETQK